jgi:hypothetical protein
MILNIQSLLLQGLQSLLLIKALQPGNVRNPGNQTGDIPARNMPDPIVDEVVFANGQNPVIEQIEEFFKNILPTLKKSGWFMSQKLANEYSRLNPDTVKLPGKTVESIQDGNKKSQESTIQNLKDLVDMQIANANISDQLQKQNEEYLPSRQERILTSQMLAYNAEANGGSAVKTFSELEKKYVTEEIKVLREGMSKTDRNNPEYWSLARTLKEREAELDLYNTILDPKNGIDNMEKYLEKSLQAAGRKNESSMQEITEFPRDIYRTSEKYISAEERIGAAEGRLQAAKDVYQLLTPGIIRRNNAGNGLMAST